MFQIKEIKQDKVKKIAVYVRSSKDLHNVSCQAQERQIKGIIKDKGDQVFRVFTDKAKSSTRDIRPAYEEMILLATSKKLKPLKGEMRICGLNETVNEVFEISGFTMIFNVLKTAEEAMAGF